MKTLILMLILLSGLSAKADDNIISTTFGYGALGTSTLDVTPSSYSDPRNVLIHDQMGMVYGMQFQHRIDQAWVGFQMQTNRTISASVGFGF